VGLAAIVLEEHAGGAVELGNDDPLSTVDDKGASSGHERNFAHVHFLLLHFLHGVGSFPIHDDQPYPGAQGGGEGQATLLTFLDVKGRLGQLIADELQTRISRMGNDGENGAESSLKALIATLGSRQFRLQKGRVRLQLSGQQEGHVEHACTLGKTLADAFFLGVGVGHGRSELRKQNSSKEVGPAKKSGGCNG